MPEARLILASASPRRRRLLQEMGLTFEVVPPEVNEVHYLDDLHGSVLENAALKCEWCRERYPAAAILAADTGIEFEGRTIMKPRSREEAAAFLRMFSGKTHSVMTGVALAPPDDNTRLHVETSRVCFRQLSEETITAYIDRVMPLDRAGAYDIDESGEMIVDHYEGSYTNIVGLPCEIVAGWLGCPDLRNTGRPTKSIEPCLKDH